MTTDVANNLKHIGWLLPILPKFRRAKPMKTMSGIERFYGCRGERNARS